MFSDIRYSCTYLKEADNDSQFDICSCQAVFPIYFIYIAMTLSHNLRHSATTSKIALNLVK